MRRLVVWHENKAEKERAKMLNLIRTNAKQEMEDDMKGIKKIARRLDQTQAKPLTYVKRTEVGPAGQPKGTYATAPEEVDEIVRQAWG